MTIVDTTPRQALATNVLLKTWKPYKWPLLDVWVFVEIVYILFVAKYHVKLHYWVMSDHIWNWGSVTWTRDEMGHFPVFGAWRVLPWCLSTAADQYLCIQYAWEFCSAILSFAKSSLWEGSPCVTPQLPILTQTMQAVMYSWPSHQMLKKHKVSTLSLVLRSKQLTMSSWQIRQHAGCQLHGRILLFLSAPGLNLCNQSTFRCPFKAWDAVECLGAGSHGQSEAPLSPNDANWWI